MSVESVDIGDHFLSTVLILSAELEPHCCLSRLELLVPDMVAPTLSLHDAVDDSISGMNCCDGGGGDGGSSSSDSTVSTVDAATALAGVS